MRDGFWDPGLHGLDLQIKEFGFSFFLLCRDVGFVGESCRGKSFMGFTRFIKTHLKGALQALIGHKGPQKYPLVVLTGLLMRRPISTLC